MSYKEIDIKELDFNPYQEIGTNWVLVSAKSKGIVNTMTASWGGVGINWNKPVATIYLRPQRYTKELIDQEDYFTITFFAGHKKELGILGKKSGRDGDKIAEVGFEPILLDKQPTFAQGKMVYVCRKLYHDSIKPANFFDKSLDKTYYPDKDYHEMYIAEIVKVYE